MREAGIGHPADKIEKIGLDRLEDDFQNRIQQVTQKPLLACGIS
jgi:hypothetical protein